MFKSNTFAESVADMFTILITPSLCEKDDRMLRRVGVKVIVEQKMDPCQITGKRRILDKTGLLRELATVERRGRCGGCQAGSDQKSLCDDGGHHLLILVGRLLHLWFHGKCVGEKEKASLKCSSE